MLSRSLVGLVLFISICAVGANGQSASAPDCQFNYTLTNRTTEQTDGITNILIAAGVARTPSINNRQTLCNSWIMSVTVDGLSASSLSLDDSQNTYTPAGGTPTAWANWEGTVLLGTNPSTTTTSTQVSYQGFYPWLSVRLGSSTGTGSVYVTLYGWKTPTMIGQVFRLPNPITQDLLFTDATYDIGKLGATRPRDLFASRTIQAGSTIKSPQFELTINGGIFYFASRGSLTTPADGKFMFRDDAGTSFNQMIFGGATSAFPSLKRTTTNLIARLADDSADTTFQASAFISGGGTPSVGTCGTIGTGSKNTAGFITSATTGSCVSVLTFSGYTAATGWSCAINNSTTVANIIQQSGSSTTTATFTGTTVSGDVLRYNCFPY